MLPLRLLSPGGVAFNLIISRRLDSARDSKLGISEVNRSPSAPRVDPGLSLCVVARNYNLFTQSACLAALLFAWLHNIWDLFFNCPTTMAAIPVASHQLPVAFMSFNLKLSKPSRINCSQLFPELLPKLLRRMGEAGEAEGGWVVWGTGDAILHRKMIRKLNPASSATPGAHTRRTHQHAVAIIWYAKSLPAAAAPRTHTDAQLAHKLHKTGQQLHEMLQLGPSRLGLQCVWVQRRRSCWSAGSVGRL